MRRQSCNPFGRIQVVLIPLLLSLVACSSGQIGAKPGDGGAGEPCLGPDEDKDGWKAGCAGPSADCDDKDRAIFPGATEICDGKDNNCDGQIDEGDVCGTNGGDCKGSGCEAIGAGKPFPTESSADPGLLSANGTQTNDQGDLVLGRSAQSLNYMWIANSHGTAGRGGGCRHALEADYNPALNPVCRGTVSKIDTAQLAEVARYFTTTCFSKPGVAGCLDANGLPITKDFAHVPSRTAVDFNFDVWVANRAFAGQPSVTKIASNLSDCVDRNNNGKIDTSADRDGDGKINVDCDGDGQPDGIGTVCIGSLAGKAPEFLGDDDECVLFTVNYADTGDAGRSVCLSQESATVGASDAWVGTHLREANKHGVNRYYRIDGTTGAIRATVDLPSGHASYGCTADGAGRIWSTHGGGTLAFFQSNAPYAVGPLVQSPRNALAHAGFTKDLAYHYGIASDGKGRIWLGGHNSCQALRYTPDNTSFDTLHLGKWMYADLTCPGQVNDPTKDHVRGIAPDTRGKVWVAITSGYIVRIPQELPDGAQDLRGSKDIWQLDAKSIVGVGIDFRGNVWGIGFANHLASRIDVDANGDVIDPISKNVEVGKNPYTYSDFTGFGLANFVLPRGTYVYRFDPCPEGQLARWTSVTWTATTPAKTAVFVRARSGQSEATMGQWVGPATASPLTLGSQISPNPGRLLEVELTLESQDKTITPVVHDLQARFRCDATPL